MKQTTLKDIAVGLGISISTVSKALKGYPDVNPITRSKILALAEKLNYVPNTSAVSLRTKQTKIIGVIIPAIVHQFFSKVIEGIIDEAEKKGYMVILLQSNEKYELEKRQIELLIQKRVDGILISLSNQTNHYAHLEMVLEREIPLVMFDKIRKSVKCSKVKIDDWRAAYDAVSYLIKKGYKKIAHFRGSLTPQVSIDRYLGYRKALDDHDIAYDSTLVYICDRNDDFKDGYDSAKKIMAAHGEVDALFAITDLVAIGAMKYFEDVGIQVPKQIAVFGFSNWFMSSVIRPTLSTVVQPDYELGRKSAELLLQEIEQINAGEPVSSQCIILPTRLEIRDST